ncbi:MULTISPECIES: type II secretion system F family protein [Cobetia]|uniref:type II secretion system F family protein n=1 Tax=Cobetia TaxID=204286 RepID=UPI00086589DB|nr:MULTISPECIES: type II secretion system F family protein [Cobetia]AOM02107.1 type II secretion system protein F [Cobetia marina]AZV31943.1 type II secretion system F family protein [Cobetia sp. ICG0124]MDI6003894.1 type II secretion system F family protein [Cobetia pacifica]
MATIRTAKKDKKKAGIETWQWTGKNSRGENVKGELMSANVDQVKNTLAGQGIVVKRLRKKSALFGGSKRVSGKDVTMFARQMATMIRAGVPVLQAFGIVAESMKSPGMRHLVEDLMNQVGAGASFSEALRKHPQHFDNLFTNLVAAGEQAGALDKMLDRVATYKEKIDSLKARVKKALYYPAAVICVGFGVTAILLIKVVPQFETLFNGFGAELPAFTQLTITMSEYAQAYWYIGLGAVVLAAFLIAQGMKRSDKFAYAMHRFMLKVPVLGDILDKSSVARYSRTLATTFQAGVPLIESLDTAAGATGSKVYERAIAQIKEDVSTGQQLNFAMRNTQLFPTLAVQMVAIGEESGALDAMLNKVADFYEEDVDNKVDALTSLLEPLIIVVLGTLVGGLVVSMYLPIFEMGNVI